MRYLTKMTYIKTQKSHFSHISHREALVLTKIQQIKHQKSMEYWKQVVMAQQQMLCPKASTRKRQMRPSVDRP